MEINEYFKTPVCVENKPEFVKSLNKASDKYINKAKKTIWKDYIKKHGGTIANGFDNPVQVVVRVHETDQISADSSTIIFDPWRTYPKADNVVYYGRQSS